MATYAMTGGATGIGASLKHMLREQGDTVIVVDIKDGDIVCDLSTQAGRQTAIEGIHERAPDGLDGFIPCAGLPPVARPLSLIAQVNYFAVIATVEGVLDLLEMRGGAVLLVSSNSAPMVPATDPYVEACLAGDEAQACEDILGRDGHTAYAGSKRAITIWMRTHVADLAARGIRINAVAPGITMTPLSEQVIADPEMGQLIQEFGDSVPLGRMAQPEEIAHTMLFMLSPKAAFLAGSVFFVDGGSDAMMRPAEF